jgi:hypothetical protein
VGKALPFVGPALGIGVDYYRDNRIVKAEKSIKDVQIQQDKTVFKVEETIKYVNKLHNSTNEQLTKLKSNQRLTEENIPSLKVYSNLNFPKAAESQYYDGKGPFRIKLSVSE